MNITIKINRNVVLIVLLTLVYTSVWGLIGFTKIVFSLPLFYFVYKTRNIDSKFRWNILILFFFIIINFYTTYRFRGQSFLDSFNTSYIRNFFPILIYFLLLYYNVSVKVLEKAIFILTTIFVFCYVFQWIIFPLEIFELLNPNESTHRFRMVGQGISSLGLFFALNKFLITKRYVYVFLMIGCVLVALLLGFRSIILTCFAVSFLLVLRINRFSIKKIFPIIIVSAILLLIAVNIPLVQGIINDMQERNATDTFDNPEYIRILQINYFLNDHFQSFSEFFWGTGIPNINSRYGEYMYSFHEVNKYGEITGTSITGWFDWGLLGLSWVLGIPFVCCLIIYALRVIFMKVPREYFYLSSWFVFLLISSTITIEFYREGVFFFHGLALYLVEKVSDSKKQINNLKNER